MGVNNENAVETLKKQLLELTNHNEQILKAIEYAEEKHKEQKRKSGEPYIVHPLSVAITLAKLKMDIPTITAGILHDTLEDTDATEEEINQLFGSEVLYLVQGVTKLEKHKFKSKDQAQAENFRKLILSTAKDLRVLIIKLADRLDNIKSLDVFRREKQVRIALETLKIYAPLAHMLGLWEIKSQLEDYSFKYLYPSEYEKVKNFVGKARKEMEEYLKKNIVKPLEEELKKAGINATIKYRFKHLYSIWEKTKRKNIPLEEVHDILGIRIITDTKLECYTALGIVHSLWTPIIGKFKDYISNPKENLYQSLHTTVLGPEGKLVEIQIRTWTMHEIAERGIAAHWAYKKGKKPNPEDLQIANALRELIDVIQHAPTKYKELYQLLPEIMGKKIYVLTPKGDVIALPEGSTPIDFAYAIHTEIGNHCAGAKVNGRLVPLSYKLKSGEIVEIITKPTKKPSPDWLNLVKTPKAKREIKNFLKKELERNLIKRGKEIWNKLVKRYGLSLEKVLKKLKKEEKEFFLLLGKNEISVRSLIREFVKKDKSFNQSEEIEKDEKILTIEELKGIPYKVAQCCHPLPGQLVKAVITKGRGLVLHDPNCPNLKNVLKVSPDKVLSFQWEEEGGLYPVPIYIKAYDRPGLLHDISSIFVKHQINIGASSTSTYGNIAKFIIIGHFKNREEFEKVLRDLKTLEGIIEITPPS